MQGLAVICQLEKDEVIRFVQRQHASVLWVRVVPLGLLLVLTSFFLFFLLRWGIFGYLFVSVVGMSTLLGIVKAFIKWDSHAFVITSKRLIWLHRPKLWVMPVISLPFDEIRQIEVVKMKGWRKVLGLSRAKIVGGQNTLMTLDAIRKPERFIEALKAAKNLVSFDHGIAERAE